MTQGERWRGTGKVRTQAGVCLIWPSSSSPPILFTCLNYLKGALCALKYEAKGGVGRVEKGDCHCYASFLWDNLHAKGVQKAHRTSTTGSSGVFSHTVQICIASSGSLCQCASCCQPLTLEGRCPNCLPRNSVPTLNAAVSSPTTDWFLPLVTAEQKLCVFL